jgi:hypothetical protein
MKLRQASQFAVRRFVGWAKRSVPTINKRARRWMVGTSLTLLCPPYGIERHLQEEPFTLASANGPMAGALSGVPSMAK